MRSKAERQRRHGNAECGVRSAEGKARSKAGEGGQEVEVLGEPDGEAVVGSPSCTSVASYREFHDASLPGRETAGIKRCRLDNVQVAPEI